MGFLRTSQCFGSHAPFFSRAAASLTIRPSASELPRPSTPANFHKPNFRARLPQSPRGSTAAWDAPPQPSCAAPVCSAPRASATRSRNPAHFCETAQADRAVEIPVGDPKTGPPPEAWACRQARRRRAVAPALIRQASARQAHGRFFPHGSRVRANAHSNAPRPRATAIPRSPHPDAQ